MAFTRSLDPQRVSGGDSLSVTWSMFAKPFLWTKFEPARNDWASPCNGCGDWTRPDDGRWIWTDIILTIDQLTSTDPFKPRSSRWYSWVGNFWWRRPKEARDQIDEVIQSARYTNKNPKILTMYIQAWIGLDVRWASYTKHHRDQIRPVKRHCHAPESGQQNKWKLDYHYQNN